MTLLSNLIKPSRQYQYLRADFYDGLQPALFSDTGGTFVFNNSGSVAQDSKYCLAISAASWADYVSPVGITEAYCFFKFRCSSLPAAANGFFNLQTAGGAATELMLGLNADGTVFCKHGTSTASSNTVGAMIANTVYNVWCYWKAAAANGVAWVAFSTNENMPTTTSPNYVSVANGNGNSAVIVVDPENTTATAGRLHYYGQIRVDSQPIGSFPA